MKSQQGVIHLLLLVAAIGVIAFLLVTSLAPFKNKLLSTLFPKQQSHASSDPTDTTYNMGVLVLKYFPLTVNGQNIDASVTGDVGDPYALIRQRTITNTDSLLNFIPKATTYLNSGTPSLKYQVVDTKEFTQAVPIKPRLDAPRYADYNGIMTANNICDYVDNKGVREVWIWAYQGPVFPGSNPPAPYLGILESKMSGPYGDISNSARYNDMPICQHTYRVYTFNYNSGADNALHSWSHQIEAELNAIDPHLFWDLWVGSSYAGASHVNSRCGWTHDPPNARFDYDYNNPTPNKSDCLNWNPDANGSSVPYQLSDISCANWSCTPSANPYYENEQLDYLVWMWQHLPGKNNTLTYQGKKLRNWWDVHGDFDKVMSGSEQKRLTLLTPAATDIISPPRATPQPTTIPISCSIIGPTSLELGKTVTYTATPDNIKFYKWTVNGGSPSFGIGPAFSWSAPGQAGSFTITLGASTDSGPSICSINVAVNSAPTPAPPPAPVTNLVIKTISQTQINLLWGSSAGANSYSVLRCQGKCVPTIQIGTSTLTNYSDSNLTCGQIYSYKIVAINSSGSSVEPNSFNSTITAACSP